MGPRHSCQRWVAIAGAAVMAAAALAASMPAKASETGPVIVVPGRPGVPVMMYGVEVSGAVIEGDWGLARPSNINPTVIYRLWPPQTVKRTLNPGYFPRTGEAPRYGRREVNVPSRNTGND